jgi:glycosyltransferase involved in cell wall biosynthesis
MCLREPGEPRREERAGLVVRRLPLRHRAGAGLPRLLAEYGAFFAMAAALVTVRHLRRRFDVVQVNSVPDALVFCALGPRLLGARILLDLQEPMPEFFATRFGAGLRHPAVRVIAALEQASIRFAHAAVTVTEQVREAFVRRGAPADKVTVVMDGADDRVFDTAPHPPRERDPSRLILMSHGTIEPQYGLDTAIAAVALLDGAIAGLELRIYGDGSAREDLRRLADELGVADRVTFSDGFVPLDELVGALADADAGVVAMKRDAFRDLTLAGKLFDFVAMRRPVLVSRTRSVTETFDEHCYVGFRSDDPADLARAIAALHADPADAERRAARAHQAGAPYRWSAQRKRYLAVIAGLLDR